MHKTIPCIYSQYFPSINHFRFFFRFKGKRRLDAILAEICWMSKTRYENEKKKEEQTGAAAGKEEVAQPEDEEEDDEEEEAEEEEEEGAVGGEEEEYDLGADLNVLDDIEYESDYDDDIINFIDEDDEADQSMDVDTDDRAPEMKKLRK